MGIRIISMDAKAQALAAASNINKPTVTAKDIKKASNLGATKITLGKKVKTIQVKVGSKKANKQYVKKYKKIFTKKNAGKKVKVK